MWRESLKDRCPTNETHFICFAQGCDWLNDKEAMKQIVMGIYTIWPKGYGPGDKPVDIGIVIEGTEVLCSLKNVAVAVAMLFRLTCALNSVTHKNSKLHLRSSRKCSSTWMDKNFHQSCKPSRTRCWSKLPYVCGLKRLNLDARR